MTNQKNLKEEALFKLKSLTRNALIEVCQLKHMEFREELVESFMAVGEICFDTGYHNGFTDGVEEMRKAILELNEKAKNEPTK